MRHCYLFSLQVTWYAYGSKDPSCRDFSLDFRKVDLMLHRLSSLLFICSYIHTHILIFMEHSLWARALTISVFSPWTLHSATCMKFSLGLVDLYSGCSSAQGPFPHPSLQQSFRTLQRHPHPGKFPLGGQGLSLA